MICEALVQTFVLMAQPKTSAPPRPGSETRNSESPMIRARTSSLILGAVVALLRTAVRKSIALCLALFVTSRDMPESTDILLARPTILPPLDPEFRPVALGNRRYRMAVAAGKTKVPLAIALERNDGHVSVFKTEIFPARAGHDAATGLCAGRVGK